ncbi:MAG: AsmA family protein [Bacteroidales bacterium]|nr:AsmA family protein [Bacteroidales bacterium]
MKKFFKITGIVLLVIIVLMIVLPFVFKGKIIEVVKQEVNKTLTADVDFQKIGLSLFSDFPYLSVNIHEVSVVGREAFTGDTLAYVEKLHLAVNVMSIFGDDGIEVRKINIHHPIANLLIDKEGNANWDIVKPSEEETAPEAEAPDTTASAFKLMVKDLSITNGNIVYDDQAGGMKFAADDLNFRLSGDLTADLVTLKVMLGIEKASFVMDGVPYLSKAKIDFNSDIEADLEHSKYTLQKNELKLNALEFDFAGWVAMPDDDIDMDLSLTAIKSEFKNFLSLIPALYAKDFASIQTAGTLAFAVTAQGKMTETAYPAFDLKLQIENAMFKYPDLPKAVDNIQVATHVFSPGGDLDNTVVDVSKFHVEMGNNPFDIKLLLKKPLSNPTFDFTAKGNINLNTINDFYPLDDDMDIAGILTADLTAKGDMATIDAEKYEDMDVTGVLEFSGGKLKTDMVTDEVLIEKLKLDFSPRYVNMTTAAKIGKNDLKADGKLENFIGYALRDDAIKGELKINSDYLNINSLMGEETAEATTPEAETEAPMSVVEIPKNVDFLLNLDVKQLIYDDFDLHQVSGAVAVKDGVLDLKNLSMKALDGDMKLAGTYKVPNPSQPEVDMKISISNVDVQQTAKTFVTIQKLLPVIDKTTGRMSLDLNMKTMLDPTMSPDLNTMNATGKISSPGVKVEDLEVLNKIADATKIDKLRKLSLDRFALNFTCVDGRVTTEPFEVKSGNIKASVFGSTGLDETIDYTLSTKIPRSELGTEANAVITKLGSNIFGTGINVTLPETIELPIGVGGTFTQPVVKLGELGNAGKDIVKDVVQQVVEQGKEKVNEQIDKALEEAKKQRDKLISEAQKQKENLVKQARDAGNKGVAEADKQGQELVKKASNPIAKKAAEESAKKLKQEAQKKSDDLVREAEKKGDDIIAKAKKEGDDLVKKAEDKKL